MNEPPPRSLLVWLGPALVHAGLVCAIFARLVWAGPRFDQFFREMKVALPSLTTTVLAVSAWVVEYFYLVIPVLAALLIANAVFLWRLKRRSPTWPRRWFWVLGVVLTLAWAVLEISYFLPMLKVYDSLSSQP